MSKPIADIFTLASEFINNLLRAELVAQGHHLTGALEASINAVTSARGSTDTLEGFSLYYAQFVNKGFPASSATFKQVPFLVRYFQERGLDPKEAVSAAFATVKTWMVQGMPTSASRVFSETGKRTDFIEETFTKHAAEIDEFILRKVDDYIEQLFQQEKSETI